MRSPRIILSTILTATLTASLVPSERAHAQTTAATDPVGYTALPLLANSDSLISIPFTRPVTYVGAIGSISGNTITPAVAPGFTANQFVYVSGTQSNTYYAIIGPNLATISGTVSVTNGSTAVTATAGLSSIAAGDEFIVNGLAYNVASVTSSTALVLSRAYTGTTGSGLTATYDHSPKEGSYYTITSNGTGSVTVNLNGDALTAVTAGTSVSVIPYWTLGTAFPAANAGVSFIASTGLTPRSFQTQILFPDVTDPGINLSSTSSYIFYSNSGGWTQVSGTVNSSINPNDTILPPTSYFTVRNAATATTFTPVGGVYMNRISVPLDTQTSTAQDNAVAIPRPNAYTLNDLGLITSGAFSSSTGPTPRQITDQLLVFDNTQAGLNKSSTNSYYYINGAWELVGDANYMSDNAGTTPIPFGAGFIIRKGVVATGATSFAQNTRNY